MSITLTDAERFLLHEARLLDEARYSDPHIHAHNPPCRASRIIANVTIERTEEAAIAVRSKLLMVTFRRNQQRLFAGTVHHTLVEQQNSTFIAAKRVDLVNCDAELDGLVLPF